MKKTILLLTFLFSIFSDAQCYDNIVAGGGHFAAKKSDGTLWGWGFNNTWGNLCSTVQNSPNPVQLCTATDWDIVTAGRFNTFGIKTNGTLWGTGENSYGSLGINSTAASAYTFTQIGTATDWVKISASQEFTLGLKSNGTLWAWGLNNKAQMGNGTGPNVLVPQQIGTASDWSEIEASDIGTGLAIKTNGTLWAWGMNNTGITGADSNITIVLSPIQVGTASDWATIESGFGHVVALKTNGTLWSWGAGGQGQTADGLPAAYFRNTPLQIGTDIWKAISVGSQSSFAVKGDGTLWGWGENSNGELGIGSNTDQTTTVQIGIATDWASVHTTNLGGNQTTIAIKNDGAVWGWGDNSEGQLGNGTYVNQPTPVLISTVCVTPLANATFEKKNAFTLYPNPAKDNFTLQYDVTQENASVALYDISGRIMYQNTLASTAGELQVNTSNYQAGIYIVVVKQNNKVIQQEKLIIE
jgi:alpha-tubulin suppressor-like RCC1 family protein